jgi:CHASE1-domain containing sensor protein
VHDDPTASRFQSDATQAPRAPPLPGFRDALVVVAVGVAVSVALFVGVRQTERAKNRVDFRKRTLQLAAVTETSFKSPLEAMLSLPAFYESSQEVTRIEFRHFVRGALRRHRGVYAFEWIPIVRGAKERALWMERAKEYGMRGYAFKKAGADGKFAPADERPEYMPIFFQEPESDAVGLDLLQGNDPVTPDKARTLREPIVSPGFRLIQEPAGGFVVAVYHAVYKGSPERCEGLVSALLRVDPIMQKVLSDSQLRDLHLALVDLDAPGAPPLFENIPGAAELLAADGVGGSLIAIGGRRWDLRAAPMPGVLDMHTGWIYLISGIVVSLLLGSGVLGLRTIRRLRQRVAVALQVGQYKLEEKLGEGGMGKVYRASHALLRRPTAMKLLDPKDSNPETMARFEREVQITSQLTHPNTIQIYDFGRNRDGLFYYAMEYLAGLPLGEVVLRAGPLPAGRVIHFLEQICGSLAEAHEVGLIHRDIKPANIFSCRRGGMYDFVKVLDFGLVKEVDAESSLTRADAIVGTPRYMCPEALENRQSMDARGDLYSVAAVGYHLLTAADLFTADTALGIISQVLNDKPAPPSERLGRAVDEDLQALILRGLSKDPNDRPASAVEMRAALLACEAAGQWTAQDAFAWWADQSPKLSDSR